MNAFILVPLLLGILAGAFVNYAGDVLPLTRRFSQPVCNHCQEALSWKEYLLYRPCHACGGRRGWRSLLVQVFYPIAAAYLWLQPLRPITWVGNPPTWLGFLVAMLILTYLGVVFVIDFEHRIIMHPVSIAGALLAFVAGVYIQQSLGQRSTQYVLDQPLATTLIGGAIGFGSMLVFYFLGEVFARYIARRRGQTIDEVALGFGDVNLAGIAGLFLGARIIPFGLLFAILTGGLASLIVILVMLVRRRYQAFTPIPYAPFLILAILYYLFF